ncbi:MAG TPA: LysR family transcriptional regulator [Candidatus Hydrogenedentes bacterium]|nr:LysR family transcriptional regulator [Candidatus Hydrogenedentota bacterium]
MKQPNFRYKHNRLQQLRGFCHAARTGSISKAAEKLYLSQPSVSLQIQALERELEAKLFERRGPRIALTPDGKRLFDMASPLVEGIDSIDEAFHAGRDSVDRGRVDIAAGGSTILYVLPKFVESFVNAHPNIELKIHNVTGRAGLELLRDGEVDFCVGPLLEIPEDIAFQPIVSYEPLLITCLGHPLASRKRITLRDISKYPLILPPRTLSTWRMVEDVFTQHGLKYEVKLEVGGWEVIKTYVELGLGISIVMSICITGDETLEVMRAGTWFPNRTYGVVTRRGRALSPQARRFTELLGPA